MKFIVGVLFLLWASDGWGETFCAPHDHEESYWVTMAGVPVYSYQSWDTPPRSSFDLDRRIEIELPPALCWAQFDTWMIDMRDHWYQNSCRWDMNNDRVIALDDLAKIITEVNKQLGQPCEPIR